MWACPPFSFIYDEVHGKTKHFLSFKVLIFTGITHWTVCFHFLSVEMYISNERRNVLWTSYQYCCRNMYVLKVFILHVRVKDILATISWKCKEESSLLHIFSCTDIDIVLINRMHMQICVFITFNFTYLLTIIIYQIIIYLYQF